jgi:hypothetical protein
LKYQYVDLAERLSGAIVGGLRENWKFSSYFECDLEFIMQIAKVGLNSNLVSNGLRLLVMLSFLGSFELSVWMVKLVGEAILLVEKNNPSIDTERLLFALLGSSFSSQDNLLIVVPSVIPVILAVFGQSARIPAILRKFLAVLCLSDHNRQLAHEGYLDLILAKSLISETVQFSSTFSFRFIAPRELCQKLIAYVSELKSSEAICSILVDGLVSESMANYLTRILACARHFCMAPQFPVGQMPPQFSASGLSPDDINSGFGIRFTLALDLAQSCLCQDLANLVSLVDADDHFLMLFVMHSGISAAC